MRPTLRLRCLSATTLLATLLACPSVLASPFVGPSFFVDGSPAPLQPTPISWPFGDGPALAAGGGQFLAAWWEDRDPSTFGPFAYAARIAADGTVLDPTGIFLSRSNLLFDSPRPVVASDGTGFFVAYRNTSKNATVYGVRIAADGTVLDDPPLILPVGWPPAISFDGSNYQLAWASGTNLAGGRFSPTGVALDPGGVVLGNAASVGRVGAAFNGTNHLCASGGGAVLVGLDGKPGTFVPWPGGALPALNEISVASDGTGFLVVTSTGKQVSHIRVGADGMPIGTFTVDLTGPDNTHPVTRGPVSLIFSNGVYAIATTGGVLPIDVAGNAQPVAPYGGTTSVNAAALASTGPSVLAAFADLPSTHGRALSMSPSFTALGGDVPISQSATQQGEAAGAFNGATALAVWREEGTPAVGRAARLEASGTLVDTTPLTLPTLEEPRVSARGSDFLVVWTDKRNGNADIYGARVAADGTVLDPTGFPIATTASAETRPIVSTIGTTSLVTWQSSAPAGALVAADGTVTPIATPPWASTLPYAISTDGTTFLVALTTSTGGPTKVRLDQVGSDGVVIKQGSPFLAFQDSTKGVDLAWGSSSYLVVVDDGNLLGKHVTSSGDFIDPSFFKAISFHVANPIDLPFDPPEAAPSVAWTGSEFVVAWRSWAKFGDPAGLSAAVVAATGQISTPPPELAILTNPKIEVAAHAAPMVTGLGNGHALMLAAPFAMAQGLGRERVTGTIVDPSGSLGSGGSGGSSAGSGGSSAGSGGAGGAGGLAVGGNGGTGGNAGSAAAGAAGSSGNGGNGGNGVAGKGGGGAGSGGSGAKSGGSGAGGGKAGSAGAAAAGAGTNGVGGGASGNGGATGGAGGATGGEGGDSTQSGGGDGGCVMTSRPANARGWPLAIVGAIVAVARRRRAGRRASGHAMDR